MGRLKDKKKKTKKKPPSEHARRPFALELGEPMYSVLKCSQDSNNPRVQQVEAESPMPEGPLASAAGAFFEASLADPDTVDWLLYLKPKTANVGAAHLIALDRDDLRTPLNEVLAREGFSGDDWTVILGVSIDEL